MEVKPMDKFEQGFIKFLAYLFGVFAVVTGIRVILWFFNIGFTERLI
jgi:hypothetical protein